MLSSRITTAPKKLGGQLKLKQTHISAIKHMLTEFDKANSGVNYAAEVVPRK